MTPLPSHAPLRRAAIAALLLPWLMLSGGCGSLLPAQAPPPRAYALDVAWPAARAPGVPRSTTATLLVTPPHAAAGHDSARIAYVREPHRLEYFARAEWVDTPARMLAPLLVAALDSTGAFAAVVPAPTAALGDLRLGTEIVRLQQEFGAPPSRVRFTLRAALVDDNTGRVLATREFDVHIDATREDPYAGVVAANLAVHDALTRVAAFCVETAGGWQGSARLP